MQIFLWREGVENLKSAPFCKNSNLGQLRFENFNITFDVDTLKSFYLPFAS